MDIWANYVRPRSTSVPPSRARTGANASIWSPITSAIAGTRASRVSTVRWTLTSALRAESRAVVGVPVWIRAARSSRSPIRRLLINCKPHEYKTNCMRSPLYLQVHVWSRTVRNGMQSKWSVSYAGDCVSERRRLSRELWPHGGALHLQLYRRFYGHQLHRRGKLFELLTRLHLLGDHLPVRLLHSLFIISPYCSINILFCIALFCTYIHVFMIIYGHHGLRTNTSSWSSSPSNRLLLYRRPNWLRRDHRRQISPWLWCRSWSGCWSWAAPCCASSWPWPGTSAPLAAHTVRVPKSTVILA